MHEPGNVLLVEFRRRTGTTQAQVAEAIDEHVPTISRWEKVLDKPNPHRPTLAKAVRLQKFTSGDVPAVSWGYSAHEVEELLRAALDLTTTHGITAAARPYDRDPDATQVAPEAS